jgi:FkbM family methyltransferase
VRRLRERFEQQADVTIIAAALSDRPGKATLHRYPDGAQNSLLPQHAEDATSVESVTVTTLDRIVDQNPHLAGPELIKVDTQGRDLQVLLGGLGTIRKYRPVVQTEVIFADLYEGQCSPCDIFALMTSEGYALADMVMAHVDQDGRLAYADWIFTPDPPARCANLFACRDPALLAGQLSVYQEAATERLALIERLDAECRRLQAKLDQRTRSAGDE